jgi:5'-nucleotidase / UDP-sugar diphosphatase
LPPDDFPTPAVPAAAPINPQGRAFLLLTLVFWVLQSGCAQAGQPVSKITILHTNDSHSELEAIQNPETGRWQGGMVRRAEVFAEIRREQPHTLIVDAGDLVQGTPFYQVFGGRAEVETYSAAGYDVVTLGNHEFDQGIAPLFRSMQNASFTLVCANVFHGRDLRTPFRPYRLFSIGGHRLAVIGVIGTEAWSSQGNWIQRRLVHIEPSAVLRPLVAHLRPDVDLVVVLSHSGFPEDLQLAAEIPGIDVIVGGHSHTELSSAAVVLPSAATEQPESQPGTIVVQAGSSGRWVGRLDLLMHGNTRKGHTWTLLPIETDGRQATTAVPASGAQGVFPSGQFGSSAKTEAGAVAVLVASYSQTLATLMDEILAENPRGFSFDRDRRDKGFYPLGTLVCEAFCRSTGAEIGLINSGGIRRGIEPGKIRRRHVFQTLPYDNTVPVITMTGRELQTFLNSLVKNWKQTKTGYQIAGLAAVFDFDLLVARDIRVRGLALQPAKKYRLATSSYLTADPLGKGIFGPYLSQLEDVGILMRDALAQYLLAEGAPPLGEPHPIKFQGNL